MKWQHSNRSKEDHNNAPLRIQKAFGKQARLPAENLRHPSLRAKKIDETNDVWQARVTKDLRFFFQIVDDTYVIVRIVPPQMTLLRLRTSLLDSELDAAYQEAEFLAVQGRDVVVVAFELD